ncbi:hypothetical protein BJ875DRAFT_407957 [Amylocarpus encephaloides]|uniref:Methyltransferase n=1 Tax=Amylocarpus encephaloides TaxID=45428 RepID=A0A9P8C3D5_9HELO|nr:hypothetical protein BJ875DRAFT_407957 [Amylocarpus encephaloides]
MEIASEASGSIGNLVPHQDFELSPNGIQSSPTPAKHPRATMSFLEPWDAGKGAPFFRSSPDEGFEGTNFKWEEKTVTVRNARDQIEQFTLDKNGFCFVNDDELSLELIHALRVGKKEVVRELYYPKVERLMKTLTGASRVIIFDHTVRKRDPSMNKEDNPNGKEQPATVVHCDQSAKGALRRVKQNISENDDINEIVDAGVQMINVWRPLIGPIVDWPLAMMDYRSLSSSDVHPCDLWRHQFEEKGQTVTFTHNENQKWYYLDRHRTNEVSLIKIWDSRREGIANMCAHVAFEHPDTPCDTTPRESVEVRCIVVK